MGSPAPTVLVVDDSPTARLQLRLVLEEAGFAVREASNGLEGLEEARGHAVDAIVVDLNMPVMTGLEMIAAVRQLVAHRRTPIIVSTTEASDQAVRRGLAAGATAWLIKPVDPEVLLPALRQALGDG
jgi:two-component system, chemotaxis family, chemotaxis protein CheY